MPFRSFAADFSSALRVHIFGVHIELQLTRTDKG
jgi:hypothetical protein